MRPLLARIDTAALSHNLGVARAAAGAARILAVIKANAYGHGLLRVAEALRGADGFAVLQVEEAAALRDAGFSHPIVLLEGFFHPDELAVIARLNLHPVIHREDQIDSLEKSRLTQRIDCLLKIDSGMHRLGVPPDRARAAIERLLACPQVGGLGLMSHFACADEPAVGVAAQMAVFRQAVAGFDLPVSLANSAALLDYPETHADWVRPGLMLYGAAPFAGKIGTDLGLRPVMHLESQLIAVQSLRQGAGIGYGQTYVAERDMRVGTVACGYADGYPRHAGTATPVLVDGRETRTLGRVSMDMLCVDLSALPDARVGSPVTLWGAGMPVERIAAAAGTLAYELFTGLAARVPIRES